MVNLETIYNELKKLETDDYQNREGNYPKSGIPDSIEVHMRDDKVEVIALFKNTAEETCKKWLKTKFCKYNILEVDSWQDGDYHDDWVQSMIVIKEN